MYISDMCIREKLNDRISSFQMGYPFVTAQLLDLGRRDAIDQALSRLVKCGDITRLGRGVYVRTSHNRTSEVETKQLIEQAVNAISTAHGLHIQTNGKEALYRLGLADVEDAAANHPDYSTQTGTFLSSTGRRSFHICGQVIHVKKVSPRKIAQGGTPVGLAISAIWHLGKEGFTPIIMGHIMQKLTPEEQILLRESRRDLPGWALDVLDQNASVDYSDRELPERATDTLSSLPVASEPPQISELEKRWTPSTIEGRWCGFGPYYAMFPVEFARKVIAQYCPPNGVVLDPFCGRGTVPFVAMATGREAAACDINPVAWVYAKVKTDPHPNTSDVLARAKEIFESIQADDRVPENEFQELAWAPDVLAYLNAARRLLNWRSSPIDRTLMGTLLVHLHAKLGDGFSNQMRQSKSMAPAYSVRWWKERNMLPPTIDMLDLIKRKLDWRYQKGILIPEQERPQIILQDAREAIPTLNNSFKADLVFTSPPYCGVTNYRYDNWIRLWLLGEGPALTSGDAKQRYANKKAYKKLLNETFQECSKVTKENAVIYVRTDARQFTLEATKEALCLAWPDKEMFYIYDGFKKATQTALYGDKSKKPGEVDLLLLPKNTNYSHTMKKEP
ncbi:DUF6088 family protein [Aeromonas dhakensis]|uniref:DUF6088 family protein n=1 Tax=Aeromonas dhakensis TaxID=196024 RepID=UPI003425E269